VPYDLDLPVLQSNAVRSSSSSSSVGVTRLVRLCKRVAIDVCFHGCEHGRALADAAHSYLIGHPFRDRLAVRDPRQYRGRGSLGCRTAERWQGRLASSRTSQFGRGRKGCCPSTTARRTPQKSRPPTCSSRVLAPEGGFFRIQGEPGREVRAHHCRVSTTQFHLDQHATQVRPAKAWMLPRC
jgi:hypothetical protein